MWNFSIGIDMWEDLLAVNQLIYYCRHVSYVPQALYHYFQLNDNSYVHEKKPALWQNMLESIRRLETFFTQNNPELLHALNYKKNKIKNQSIIFLYTTSGSDSHLSVISRSE